jgi:hypothetical protein
VRPGCSMSFATGCSPPKAAGYGGHSPAGLRQENAPPRREPHGLLFIVQKNIGRRDKCVARPGRRLLRSSSSDMIQG